MKQILLFNEQGSCYKCPCELFNTFWCFRFENWYDNSVSINSIFINKIDSPNSKIDNYRLLTLNAFVDFYRISKKIHRFLSIVIKCYRLSMLSIDYPGRDLNTDTLNDLPIWLSLPSIAKVKSFSSTSGVLQKIFRDKVHAILIEEVPVLLCVTAPVSVDSQV